AVAPLVTGESGDTASMSDALSASTGETPAGFTRSSSGSFTGSRAALEYSYDLTCQDSEGTTLAQCNASTDTASVNVSWSGDFNTLRYDTEISRTGSWTLSGIGGAVAELNGEGSFDIDSEFMSLDGNRQRTYRLAYSALYSAVQIDTMTRSATGGTASFAITADRTASNRFRDVEASFDISAEVTFTEEGAVLVLDGTRSYDLVVNLDGSVTVMPPESALAL
ncbi:MAG: hypothetical protein AAF658_12960, partial [Myxococcota bacterium]